ncbi:type II toxin-antitoxin system RelE family toxin [Nocardiopsis valliformis]|uniref:type II toxin-antitoxin system RelE family toxin n=1 Tax=Nocardiopsis valliformis TaxID=239974 RepID=UPI001EF9EEAE|nr:type II toxin-antitoxin system RelE/ParE family toxin [Nocardiopsis valliformis]
MRKRVQAALTALSKDPRPRGCVKIKGQALMWRIRVGEYRVLYEIDDGVLTILVLKVASRDGFYDDL